MYPSKIENEALPLTNQSFYKPTNMIPYVNLKKLIIVQLTHELLDIFFLKKMEPTNHILKKYINGSLDIKNKIFIIIDCLDDNLLKNINFHN